MNEEILIWVWGKDAFLNIRDFGMTYACHGLSRAFPCVELEPIKFAVDSSNELVYRISCFRGLSHGDDGADADDVVYSRLIEGFLSNFPMRYEKVYIYKL